MGKSAWTTGGHYIAVVDYKIENGIEKFYVIDSGGKQRNGWWIWNSFASYVKHFYTITNPNAGKKGYTGTYPSKFPLRGYYKYGDGWKTCTSAAYKEQIKYIQQFLNWAVNAKLVIDGEFGTASEDTCKNFQRKVGLVIDGEFGKKTLEAAKKFAK